jgi:Secretion system C-terminal sorting domain/Beta-propeller repeat
MKNLLAFVFVLITSSVFANSDLFFIENKGDIRNEKGGLESPSFYLSSADFDLFVYANQLSYQFKRANDKGFVAEKVSVQLEGANVYSRVESEKPCAPVWKMGLKRNTSKSLLIRNVYPGVDWRIFIHESGVKYEFLATDKAAASQIQMNVLGAKGVSLVDQKLLIRGEMGDVIDDRPIYFFNGKSMNGSFIVEGNKVKFDLNQVITEGPVVIDPTIIWTSYYGGSGLDDSKGIYTDAFGNYYVTGTTTSTSLISFNGAQGLINGGTDFYVVKFNSSNQRVWSSYFGGSGDEVATDIVVDDFGGVFVSGSTTSLTGVALNSQQVVYGGGPKDGLIVKFNDGGQIEWSSYYGGNGDDKITSMSLGFQGEIVFLGETSSTNLLTLDPIQSTFGGGASDVFVGMIDMTGFLLRNTYWGSTGAEIAGKITASADYNYYFCGSTNSASGIAQAGPQTTYGGGTYDGFLVKLDGSGFLQWSTYLGGTSEDHAYGVQASTSQVVLVGKTASVNGISSAGAFQLFNGGGSFDGYVASYDPNGTINWKSYYGGTGNDGLNAVQIDDAGTAFVLGSSSSSNLGDNGFQNANAGLTDLVIAGFTESGSRIWSSYLGGSSNENAFDLHKDQQQYFYFAGSSESSGIANGGYSPTNNGGGEAFFGKIENCDYPYLTVHVVEGDTILCEGQNAILCAGGADHFLWSTGDTTSTISVETAGLVYLLGSTSEGCATRSEDFNFLVLPAPSISISADGPIEFCGNEVVTLTATGGLAYTWSNDELSESIVVNEEGTYSVVGVGENGCEGTSNAISIVVNEVPDVVMAIPSDSLCISSDPMGIVGLPLGGTFIGDGVVGSTIDPLLAGGGAHTVYYTYTDANGCSNNSAIFDFFVLFEPTALFIETDTVYPGDAAVTLTGLPAGGYYTGLGVSGNQFYPNLAPLGWNAITYNYVDDNGCTNRDTQYIYVCCVGINEEEAATFQMFPNPTNGTVIFSFGLEVPTQYEVFDLTGRVVESNQFGSGQTSINLGHLANGRYILKFSGEENWQPAQLVIEK